MSFTYRPIVGWLRWKWTSLPVWSWRAEGWRWRSWCSTGWRPGSWWPGLPAGSLRQRQQQGLRRHLQYTQMKTPLAVILALGVWLLATGRQVELQEYHRSVKITSCPFGDTTHHACKQPRADSEGQQKLSRGVRSPLLACTYAVDGCYQEQDGWSQMEEND